MSFNYNSELKKFNKEWEETERYYTEQGMPQSSIDILRYEAWEEFKATRNFYIHNQSLTPTASAADENGDRAESLVIKRLGSDLFAVPYDAGAEHSRFWWIEEITCEPVAEYLRSLNDEELEILTLRYFDGYSVPDIALIRNRPYRTVFRHLTEMTREIKTLYTDNLTKIP